MYEATKDFIATLGFPIFVASFLLFRLEKRIEQLWDENKQSNIILAVLLRSLTDGTAVPAEILDELSGATPVPPPTPLEEGD